MSEHFDDALQEARWERLANRKHVYNHGYKTQPLTHHKPEHERARELQKNALRSHRRRYHEKSELVLDSLAAPSSELDVLQYLRLERTICAFPVEDQCIWMAQAMGYSWREISHGLRYSFGAIRWAVQRVNQKLSEVFQ